MKVSDKFRVVIKFGSEDPRGFFVSPFITHPSNQIQQLALLSPIVDLASRILATFNLGLPLVTTGGGRIQLGMVLGEDGYNMETWKTGWTARM
jgi:hypothetical protein